MSAEHCGLLAAADAVFDAERALRRAAETIDELSDVAASSLRVLDDAATDAFYAQQEERRDFYLESAGEHLGRLRNRSGVMNDLGDELSRYLSTAGSAIERAGEELGRGRGDGVYDHDIEVRALRTQVDVLGEVVALARPVADQITRHAQHAAEASAATDALMLLDSRVHQAGQEVTRADEGVSIMRSVIESAQSRARTSAALAGSLSYAASHPPAAASGRWDTTSQPWSSGPPRQTHQPDKPADPGNSLALRIDQHLVRWAMQKFKRLRGKLARAWEWLNAVRRHQPRLFAHWHLLPSTRSRPVGAV